MTRTVDARSDYSLRRQPFFYLATTLTAGVIAGRQMNSPTPLALLAAVTFGASAALILMRRQRAATVTLLAGFVISGALLSIADGVNVEPTRLRALYEGGSLNANDPVHLNGMLRRPAEPAPGAAYLDLKCQAITTNGRQSSVTGSVRLMVDLEDGLAREELAALKLGYGSVVRILVRLERAGGFKNPGSPDFDEILAIKGYDLQGLVKSPLLIEKIAPGPANSPLEWLYELRLRAITQIDKRFQGPTAGTLKAMLFGNRYYMDPEVADRLRAGATFHVLSISGMHVGILAWVLLGGWNTFRKRRLIRVGLAIGVLWAYAVMVGLDPPVLRATLMITVGLIGPMLFRRAASLNTVAIAAFLMIVLSPAVVYDPGFQLSFIAVAGIVTLAVPIAEKLRSIGEWRPAPSTPHPPNCAGAVRKLAECLYWNQVSFDREMQHSAVRYRLQKSRVAAALSRWRLQWPARALVLGLITSAAIQLTTLPLMVIYFNRVSPIGVLLNVTSGILTAAMMLLGLAAITLGGILPSIASILARVVYVAHDGLADSVLPFLSIPGASFRLPNLYGWSSVAYYIYFLGMGLAIAALDRWRPAHHVIRTRKSPKVHGRGERTHCRLLTRSAGACAVAAALLAVLLPPPGRPRNGWLTMSFLDVGQGDSALAVFPRGTTMLIDGGGELRFGATRATEHLSDGERGPRNGAFKVGESVVSRFLWSRGLTRVDYLLATHAHEDHIGGLRDVIGNFATGQVIIGVEPRDDPEFERFAAVIDHRLQVGKVKAGDRFFIDGVELDVLWPDAAAAQTARSGNNESVVIRVIYGAVAILLAGDIEAPSESEIVRSGVDLRADVLKVAHHGSKTSSTESFLDRVRPRFAVISVGERSPFGHPDPEVLARLEQRGAQVFQTGKCGTMTVETDGKTIRVSTYQGGSP
jgi:competence protein ComEC